MNDTEYDQSLIEVLNQTSEKILVKPYCFMLLGKEAPKYFRVDRPELDKAAIMKALYQQYSMAEEEFE